MKNNNSKQNKQNKNLTKPTEEKKEKNLYFITSMNGLWTSFLIVAMQENLWSNGTMRLASQSNLNQSINIRIFQAWQNAGQRPGYNNITKYTKH